MILARSKSFILLINFYSVEFLVPVQMAQYLGSYVRDMALSVKLTTISLLHQALVKHKNKKNKKRIL